MSLLPRERLRLQPDQDVLPYIHEHIANTSVKHSKKLNHWTWKFDYKAREKYSFDVYAFEVGLPKIINALKIRVAIISGEHSKIVTPKTQAYMKAKLGKNIPHIIIPGAGHHCFLDQPLACVAALRVLFAEWHRSSTAKGDGKLLPRLSSRSTHSNSDGDNKKMKDWDYEKVFNTRRKANAKL